MKRPKLLAVGGAHVDRRGQVAGAVRARRVQSRQDARGCRRRRLQCAAQRGAARHRLLADVGARRRFGRRERRRAPFAEAKIRDLSAVFLDRATPSYTALIDRDGDVIAGLADMELYETVFAKQLRRSQGARRDRRCRRDPVRRQSAGGSARAAGGARRRQAAVRHRDLAGQGGAVCRRAGQRLLPVHERPRGGRPVGDARASRPGRTRRAAARAGLRQRRHHLAGALP